MSDKKKITNHSKIDELVREYLRKYHQTVYSPEDEDNRIKKFVATMPSQKLQALFADMLGLEPESILDIGCGAGNFLRGLPVDWKKYGLEYRPEAVEIARLLADDQTQIYQGKAEELHFESNKFDVVTSFQVIEHVNNPDLMISEMFRVTKPGGLVYGELPNKFQPKEGHVNLIYPQLLPMWLRKPYIDYFSKTNNNSVEFDYLRNINYLTPKEICYKLRKHATNVFHLTPVQLQERFRTVFPAKIANVLGRYGANFGGIRFVAIK